MKLIGVNSKYQIWVQIFNNNFIKKEWKLRSIYKFIYNLQYLQIENNIFRTVEKTFLCKLV